MNDRYIISLIPIDRFFFGGDMTFPVGNDDKDEFNSRYSSYIIKSSLFPQQTSLLGMLRFQFLKYSGWFSEGHITPGCHDKVAGLIGQTGFRVRPDHSENDFGCIERISGCRLQHLGKDGRTWCDLYTQLIDGDMKPDMDKTAAVVINEKSRMIPQMPGYDPKKGLVPVFKGKDGTFIVEDIFIEDKRLGIDRNIHDGRTEDNSMYKQVCYRLKKGFRFAFEACIRDSDFLRHDGDIVSVGGDNSCFMMHVERVPSAPAENSAAHGRTVVLTSPTWLEEKDCTDVPFAVTSIMPFRFIMTDVMKTRSYDIVNNKSGRSMMYQLFSPGSSFMFRSEDEATKFANIIESKKDFRQIGYNEYKIK